MPGEHGHFGALIKVVDFALGQLRSKHLSHALQQLQRETMIEIEEWSRCKIKASGMHLDLYFNCNKKSKFRPNFRSQIMNNCTCTEIQRWHQPKYQFALKFSQLQWISFLAIELNYIHFTTIDKQSSTIYINISISLARMLA